MALSDYGIVSIDTPFTMKFSKRKKVEPGTPVLTHLGAFSTNVAKKLHWLFNAEGSGDPPADFALAGAGPTVDGITGGKTIVETVEESQTNDGEPNKWSASAVHAPGVGA